MPTLTLCVIARQRAALPLLGPDMSGPSLCYGSALDHHNFPVRACTKCRSVAGGHDRLMLPMRVKR